MKFDATWSLILQDLIPVCLDQVLGLDHHLSGLAVDLLEGEDVTVAVPAASRSAVNAISREKTIGEEIMIRLNRQVSHISDGGDLLLLRHTFPQQRLLFQAERQALQR